MSEQAVCEARTKPHIAVKVGENLCVLLFCVAYVVSVCVILPPNMMNGEKIVSSFSKSFSLLKTMLSIVTVFLLKYIMTCVVRRDGTVTYYTLRILFFLYEIPVVLSFGLFEHDNFTVFIVSQVIYWILICLCAGIFGNIRPIRFLRRTGYETGKGVRLVLVGILLCGLFMSIRRIGGFSFSLSFLDGVYSARAYYKENTSDLVTFFKTAIGAYLCPCLIVFYCVRRKKGFVAAATLIQLFFFSLAKDKIYLFLIPIAYVVGLLGRRLAARFNTYLHAGYLLYAGALTIAILGAFRTLIYTLVTRRMMVVPAYFSYVYYDFFTKNPPIWWRQDTFLIDRFFSPVYTRSVPLEISHVCFADLEGNPNAGMFAEAFSRCGYLGIVIYPVLFCAMLRLVDRFYARAETEIRIMVGICLALMVSNDVITSTSFVMTMAIVLLGAVYFKKDEPLESIGKELAERAG